MNFTKEQKAEYFQALRARWQSNKALADQDQDARARYNAIIAEAPDHKISYYSFYFTLCDMKSAGYDGNPYIDTKTFNGWKSAGYIVKKGESSKISGITWIRSSNNKTPGTASNSTARDDDDGFIYPKQYNLFHKSQVTAI